MVEPIIDVTKRPVPMSRSKSSRDALPWLSAMFHGLGDGGPDVERAALPVDRSPSLRAVATVVLFMPVMICMTYASTTFAITSVQELERNSTSWAPPIYPYKIIMALCFGFLLLQGVSNLIKDLQIIFGSSEEQS